MKPPRRAVITGGSSGLGLHFAREFASRGAEVLLLARGTAGLAKARENVEAASPGARVTTHAVDVSDAAAVREAAARIAPGGDVDLLVNSAGIIREGYVDTVDDDFFRSQMDINYFGTVHATRAFLPQLRRTRGRIVNIGSLSGVMGVFGYSGYCASKFAVQGFSETLRLELAPAGVAVHVVCPGEFESPMLEGLGTNRTPENLAQAKAVAMVTTAAVVRATIRGIEAGRFEIVPGLQARVLRALVQHFPGLSRRVSDRLVGRVYVGPAVRRG